LAAYREDETGRAYSASLPDVWSLSIRADQRHCTRARNNEAGIAPSAPCRRARRRIRPCAVPYSWDRSRVACRRRAPGAPRKVQHPAREEPAEPARRKAADRVRRRGPRLPGSLLSRWASHWASPYLVGPVIARTRRECDEPMQGRITCQV